MDVRETISGIIGSACLVYTGLPFDTVKVRLQTRGAEYGHSIMRCGTTMVRKESVRSLWKGALPALSSGGIENAVLFTANGFFRRVFSAGEVESLSLLQHAAIGGLSGVFSATAICPVCGSWEVFARGGGLAAEVIKCKLQHFTTSHGTPLMSPIECIRKVAQTRGLRGFFAGLSPLLARDVPFNTIFFGTYNTYCALLRSWLQVPSDAALGPIPIFIAGGFAGMSAWTVVFPFDTVKSAMQVAEGKEARSMMWTMRSMVQKQGIRGLYGGWAAAVLRAFPANAALFSGYELSMKLLAPAVKSEIVA